MGRNRVRICDLAILRADAPREKVTETPPLLCIEILALRLRADVWPRIAPLLGCVPILVLAAKALRGALHDPAHVEGYILLIALGLVLQAALTLLTLGRRPVRPPSPLQPL